MMGMMNKILLTFVLFVTGMGGVLFSFLVHADDARLQLVGYGYQLSGRPATALVYSLYENRRPKQFFMLWQGKRMGTEYLWYDNGALMAERPHSKGLPHGSWKMWYEDGSAKSLKHYKYGAIDGEVWGWHPNGQISDYNFYVDDKEITHKSWVSDGVPYYNYVFQDGRKVGMKGGDFCKRLEVIKK